jgi:hypothetical protein
MSSLRRTKEKIMRAQELCVPIVKHCVETGPYDPSLIEYIKDGRIYDALEYAKSSRKNISLEVVILSLESALETIKEEYPT